MKNFNQRVFAIVRRIPRGKVMNYGQTARLAGSPHAARAVGYALHQARAEDNVPWQRVVYKDGGMAFADAGQRALLAAEGAVFTDEGKVDMAVCGWDASISAASQPQSTWPSAAGMPQRLRLNCFFNA